MNNFRASIIMILSRFRGRCSFYKKYLYRTLPYYMLYVKETTQHVSGLPIEHGGSGDPSPMTAYGEYCGILAALAWSQGLGDGDVCDRSVVDNRVIAVQGLGHVGLELCRQLHEPDGLVNPGQCDALIL